MNKIAMIIGTTLGAAVTAVSIPAIVHFATKDPQLPTPPSIVPDNPLGIKGQGGPNSHNEKNKLRIKDLGINLMQYKSPMKSLYTEFEKAGNNKKYVDVFRNTYEIYQKMPKINAKERCKIYASSCRQDIDGDIHAMQAPPMYSHKSGNIYVNNGRSIAGIYDVLSNKKINGGKIAVVNFADYFKAGGGVAHGRTAQEECLSRCTDLTRFLWDDDIYKNFYAVNQYLMDNNKINELGDNRGIYVKGVTLLKEDSNTYRTLAPAERKKLDIITVAAPDLRKFGALSKAERKEIMKSRIKLIFDMARHNNVDTLGFGAFGCGVFAWDPNEVADICKDLLETEHYKNCFKNVVFNIPDKTSSNYKAFQNKFAYKT